MKPGANSTKILGEAERLQRMVDRERPNWPADRQQRLVTFLLRRYIDRIFSQQD